MSSSKGSHPTGQTPRFCYTIYTTIRFFYFTFCDYTTKITHTGMIVKRRSSNYRYVSRIITVFNILITILRETEHPKRVDPGQTHRSVTPEGTISIHRNTEIYWQHQAEGQRPLLHRSEQPQNPYFAPSRGEYFSLPRANGISWYQYQFFFGRYTFKNGQHPNLIVIYI